MDDQQLAVLFRDAFIAATKAVSSTPSATYGHGQGGAFSSRGLEQPVFNAMILPQFGLQALLPKVTSNVTDPLYGIFTGVTATTGSDPSGVCDDPKTAGLAKLCTHSFSFGRQSLQSQVYQFDRIGELHSRADFTDLQLIGAPSQTEGMAMSLYGRAGSGVLNNERDKALFEFVVSWYREHARELYTGNPTNNSAGGGRKYYRGLDLLINTGYRDAESGIACPAADSIVASFGNKDVSQYGGDLVRAMTSVFHRLQYIASMTGLAPVTWAISMPWGLFHELTEVWPCAYNTYRCGVTGNNTINISLESQTEMRDGMRGNVQERTGQYLLIDGVKVPVVLDDAITETAPGSGVFRASIYFVPLRVLGGRPVTWMEFFSFNAPGGAMDFAKEWGADSYYKVTDGGRYVIHAKPPTNWCMQFAALSRPRLILLTPHLAARLTDVQWTPMVHERQGFTGDPYHVNGGMTNRTTYGPSYYSPTA